MTSSEWFQQHFSIISKNFCCGFYMKKNVTLTLISLIVLKWNDRLSVQLPFELPVQIPFQLLLELEPNWLVQNVVEIEFELSRMYVDETSQRLGAQRKEWTRDKSWMLWKGKTRESPVFPIILRLFLVIFSTSTVVCIKVRTASFPRFWKNHP